MIYQCGACYRHFSSGPQDPRKIRCVDCTPKVLEVVSEPAKIAEAMADCDEYDSWKSANTWMP